MLKSSHSGPFEVLIVDDDKVVALLHKNSLRASNITNSPVVCKNGQEALEYLQKNDCQGKLFLVLLDLNMPVLDGWKFLKKLQKNPPRAEVLIIVVTSSINQKDYLKARTYDQVIHFCRKPLSAECILKIREIEPMRPFFPESTEGTEPSSNTS